MTLSPADIARFLAKVDTSAGPKGCWPWRGGKQLKGYGIFYLPAPGRWVQHKAHRVAYVIAHGSIPDGLTVDHVRAWGCTRRDCQNPSHLEAVDGATNIRRARLGGPPFGLCAVNARKTHCLNGHPLVAGNLEASALRRGGRRCLTCHRLRHRRERARASA